MAVNGALMSSAWFFLPASLKDAVFSLHGSLAFAAVLASWMYSDVPATNVLGTRLRPGPPGARGPGALPAPAGGQERRAVAADHAALRLVALLIGLANHNLLSTVITVVWIGIVPFGALGISNLVGIRFPYHPMPLRFRWEHRRPFGRMIVRWLALAVTPVRRVPGIIAAAHGAHADSVGPAHADRVVEEPARDRLRLGRGRGLCLAVAGWWGGHRSVSSWPGGGPTWLDDFLADPARA